MAPTPHSPRSAESLPSHYKARSCGQQRFRRPSRSFRLFTVRRTRRTHTNPNPNRNRNPCDSAGAPWLGAG
eukprot:4269232-Pyramimonas_sp.AAC.1